MTCEDSVDILKNTIMMNIRHAFWWKLSLLILLNISLIIGCGDDNKENNTSTGPGPTTSNSISGQVTGSINHQPLSGVKVSAQGKSATTNSNGNFTLPSISDGTFGITLEGNDIYTRRQAVTVTASNRSALALNAIEKNSAFNLAFYRELARGNHPNERDLYQTHRWTNTTAPTFYIDTDASVTLDGMIDQNQINRVTDVIRQIVPVFTGNFYSSSVTISTKPFTTLDFRVDVPTNTYVISFDDTLMSAQAFGITETDPDFVSPVTTAINRTIVRVVDDMSFYTRGGITFEEVVAHEMGHGFGFRHTSELYLRSVMVAIGEFGGLFSDADRIHMALMYSRPAGNTDIDNDPITGAKMAGHPIGKQVFVDRLAQPITLTQDEMARLEALPNKLPSNVAEQLQQ